MKRQMPEILDAGTLIIIGIVVVIAIAFGWMIYAVATGDHVDQAYGVCESDCEAFGYEYYYCSPGNYGNDHCWCETPDGVIERIY